MTERNERVERLISRFILERYRERYRDNRSRHLPQCAGLFVAEVDASDSTYGCDTGCDYVRFEAEMTCPHGKREPYEWGQFGELASIIENLESEEAA